MEYYCYISQTKVDQIVAEIGEDEPDELSVEKTQSREKKVAGGLGKLLALFNADLSYGRSDVLQTKATVKKSYAQKLKRVLNHVAEEVIELPTLRQDLAPPGGLFLLRSQFTVDEIDQQQLMAALKTTLQDHSLVLHCSLKFFSESPLADGQPRFHSSNYAFFEKRLPIEFEALFFLLSWRGFEAFGSPLYLKLSAQRDLLL